MEVDGIVVVDNFEASNSTNIEHDFSMNSNASYEKLVDYPVVSNELNKNKVASAPVDFKGGYQIVDVDTLASTFKIFACPECLHVGHVDILKLKKQGLAFQFQLRSDSCEWVYNFWTSKKLKKIRSFDINKRIFYAMRRMGKGYAGLNFFLTLMNLPPPMTKSSYHKLSKKIHKAVKSVANRCMQDAVNEIRMLNQSEEVIIDIGISNDGAWQKRGFTSLNGNVATISMDTGRILDSEMMSRYCQMCVSNEHLKNSDPEKYELFRANHGPDCMINHKGSAPAMEVSGTKSIFERSIASFFMF